MQRNLSIYVAVLAALAVLTVPLQVLAQEPRYKLIDMGTFGGPTSDVNNGGDGAFAVTVLNNQGALAGAADTSVQDPFPDFCFNEDCYVGHAFQYHAGVRTDLGALADGLSSLANWISESGLVAGGSQNGRIDPLFPGRLPETRAVLWRDGHITNLRTLPEGGFESWANAVNSSGQVVGWATNKVPDEYSLAGPGFLPTQTRAFLWQHGTMEDLSTLGGPDAFAQFINEKGQVVGWSYTNSTPNTTCPALFPLAEGSFLWERGKGMQNLGTLGGDCTGATGLNNSGTVVGFSVNNAQIERAFIWSNGRIRDLGGSLGGHYTGAEGINDQGVTFGWAYLEGDAIYHATIWKRVGDMTDLGVLDDGGCSYATSMNSKGQVVGGSLVGCNFDNNTSAFLWKNGQIYNLNSLIPAGASLHLQVAQGINERGEIAGIGVDINNENYPHAFLLVPCDANSDSDCQEVPADNAEGDSSTLSSRQPYANQNSVRRMLRRPLGQLVHMPGRINNTAGSPQVDGKIKAALPIRANAQTALLQLTGSTPPSGVVGTQYGNYVTEYFSCRWNPVLGWHLACFRCDPSIPGSCPSKYGNCWSSPCLRTQQVFVSFAFAATGGLKPYSWSSTGMPPGLTLNSSTGAVSGKPTVAGNYSLQVTVRDAANPPAVASSGFTIEIQQ